MADRPATRGSWTLDEAVVEQWRSQGVEQHFRNEWPVPTAQEYQALNDGEARPSPPGPYCVYEKMPPVVLGHMSGAVVDAPNHENQLQSVLIQFRIHAKSSSTESAKAKCVRLAKKVANAFDPHNALTICDDSIVVKKRMPDFHARAGEDEWVWVLQYELTIDAEYLQ